MAWEDKEWPAAAKNALRKLWGVYDDSNIARIDERIQNAKLVKELSGDKTKIDKKYYSLVVVDQELVRLEEIHLQKTEVLKNEVSMLKQIQRTQAEMMKSKQKKWDDEKDAMKEKNKKLKYMLFDMLKASEANKRYYKDKLEKIKELCDD